MKLNFHAFPDHKLNDRQTESVQDGREKREIDKRTGANGSGVMRSKWKANMASRCAICLYKKWIHTNWFIRPPPPLLLLLYQKPHYDVVNLLFHFDRTFPVQPMIWKQCANSEWLEKTAFSLTIERGQVWVWKKEKDGGGDGGSDGKGL